MPKRRASGDFLCPGCQSKFDPESHAPFMGSCGHSLCGVCVNQKQLVDCFVCGKEGSFALKQRNDLASELLDALANNKVKKAKFTLKFEVGDDTYSSAEQVPAILDPTNRAFLAQIVNQLDPKSFINLASSCKSLYNYCFNSNEIKIVYGLWMSVCKSKGVYCFMFGKTEDSLEYYAAYKYKPMNYSGKKLGFLGSKFNRKKLANYPFVFRLEKLKIRDGLDEDFNRALLSFLGEFPIESITKIGVDSIRYWHGFLQLLKDFKIRDVEDKQHVYYDSDSDADDRSLPKDVAAYILQNTDRLHANRRFPAGLILNASVKELNLPCANISKATYMDLLKRFSSSAEDIEWKFGCKKFEFGHHDLFPVLPFNYQGPLPEERPLVFANDAKPNRFSVLRQDGKILDCYKSTILMSFTFSTRNSYGFPPVFPAHYYEQRQLSDSDDDFDEDSDDFSSEKSDG